eukprot:1972908-Amphidinium_carterae.3
MAPAQGRGPEFAARVWCRVGFKSSEANFAKEAPSLQHPLNSDSCIKKDVKELPNFMPLHTPLQIEQWRHCGALQLCSDGNPQRWNRSQLNPNFTHACAGQFRECLKGNGHCCFKTICMKRAAPTYSC